MDWNRIQEWAKSECGVILQPASRRSVGGGCINEAWLIDTDNGAGCFLKLNSAQKVDLFEAEMAGLKLLRSTGAIRLPEPIGFGVIGGTAVFMMEAISLTSNQGADCQALLGRQLAELHQAVSANGQFGGDFDNHIGETPQQNGWLDCWADFFIEKRLRYQFELAEQKSLTFHQRESLESQIRKKFEQRGNVEPVLLHGDLWSGNVAFDDQGQPVIFDPACYYGDREADIAFTKMFGGFSPAFYQAYREVHPAPNEEEWFHRLYNLYHELNHFNLFGGGYGAQAQRTVQVLNAP